MDPNALEVFHHSLNRCTSNEDFLERFYWLFMASSPDVREKFARTNWLRQKRMMVASFHMMIVAEEDGTDGNEHLRRVAHTHSKEGRDIPAHLYDVWLECLLKAVREFDPQWNQEVEDIWKRVMQRGITYMKNHYEVTLEK